MSASSSDKDSRRARGAFARLSLPVLVVCALGLAAASDARAQQRDIVLMLDNSGSMRKNDPEFLTRVAVRAFLEGLRGDNHVAVVAFDQQVRLLMPLTPLDDSSRPRFLASLDAVNYRGLLTNSPAALERSLYELREHGRAGAEKSIVFMTDGIVDVAPEGPDDGDVEKARWMKSTLADAAAEASVRIFGIAFTDNADFELIQTLAKRTGGEYYRAYTAGDIDGVFEGVRGLLSGGATAPPPTTAPTATVTPGIAASLPPPVTTTLPGPGPSAPQAPGSLPDSGTLPGTGTPLPDSGTPAAATGSSTSLPGTGSGGLPVVSLSEADIPKVSLPDVNLAGGASQPAATESTAAASTAPGSTAKAPPELGASAQPPAGTSTTTAPAPAPVAPPAAPPEVLDDPKLLMALAVGGVALLLALAALVIVLMRRRGRPAAGADPLMPKAFLNDIGGVTENKSYELGAKPVIVGRLKGPEVDGASYIVIDETTIGRRHALLEYKEHSFWVTDQNSLNGTFVNNARIDSPTRLKHGDRIRFHKHEFEFLVLDMFETDRTMMSETVFANISHGADAGDDDDDATVVRENSTDEPSPEDPTVTRP